LKINEFNLELAS